jgi:serine/threonine protein kinase
MTFCAQIAAGLAYCHSQGISHGDIKPQNILIDAYRRCKLVDFGLSQHFETKNTSTMFLGSLLFMAPEVILKQAFDPFIADVWSLGITFYWMAVGASPWPDCQTIMKTVQCGLPPMPTSLPIQFRNLLKAMVECDPTQRITTDALVVHLGLPPTAPPVERPTGRRSKLVRSETLTPYRGRPTVRQLNCFSTVAMGLFVAKREAGDGNWDFDVDL